MAARIGCYPGSFDPPTIAHLAVAEAAVAAARLERLDLVVSRSALGKAGVTEPTVQERAAVLHEVASSRPWLGVVVTDAQLIVEIAQGYDAVVMGADKWRQVTDPTWYADDPRARDRAVSMLPRVLVAPRAGDRPLGVEVLEIDERHHHVSSSAIRVSKGARVDWVVPEALSRWQRAHQ